MMRRVLLYLIRLYQRYLSPMKRTKCPYVPSCSAYGAEAIRRYGAAAGSALALWRILRCNPFSKGGFDPVPQRMGRMIYTEAYTERKRKASL